MRGLGRPGLLSIAPCPSFCALLLVCTKGRCLPPTPPPPPYRVVRPLMMCVFPTQVCIYSTRHTPWHALCRNSSQPILATPYQSQRLSLHSGLSNCIPLPKHVRYHRGGFASPALPCLFPSLVMAPVAMQLASHTHLHLPHYFLPSFVCPNTAMACDAQFAHSEHRCSAELGHAQVLSLWRSRGECWGGLRSTHASKRDLNEGTNCMWACYGSIAAATGLTRGGGAQDRPAQQEA